ncbi:bifunctional methylenetetrahydrofolate dehydrogenase/methenyltetrahydrofolate cyclohydrolase FolD [Helicobacter himalayensis]|uniref:bifunctional methylenetetrahydrofolate dehydrogenase/methenyltetrahydrofolate cyclohydrolase FolD n=1 Tax=Helicobacter himalayensis TaxID=1591088 RepID=UPI000833DFA9|nr:bifunctional methylenetetrahydrofolate dehydrogenase/methenyltetrahydrofolate cyclohydrolase FolD [Helicobacter himalayensis]
MELLNGKDLAQNIESQIIAELKKQDLKPSLAVILVGDDPASRAYVNMKQKACERVGFVSLKFELPTTCTQEEILSLTQKLNNDASVHGILVQLPLPKHIDTSKILESIAPQKDVDGFHPYNVGRLRLGLECFCPATPLGVMNLLAHYKIEVRGKNVAIIGASNIVGKPLAALMLNAGATPSLCHILTRDISSYTREADIVCVGVGKPNLLNAEMIKQGTIVIDIGINRLENGRLVGDVDFEPVSKKCSFITPVPGGVGPMTIATLLQNTLKAAKNFHK